MAEAVHQFGSILLGGGGVGGVSNGSLKITGAGFNWKRAGGGQSVDVKKEDIQGLYWRRSSKGCQLGVETKDGSNINFQGFRDKDLESLQQIASSSFGTDIAVHELATSGHNWGAVALVGSTLQFVVGGKVAFELPMNDVAQAQQVKDDVVMEFTLDDTATDDRQDALAEIVVHMPQANKDLAPAADGGADVGGGSSTAPAKLLVDAVLSHTEAGGAGAAADEVVASFSDVAVLAPRGRFEVEMHPTLLKLAGQTQDFKIRYSSITRLFILPKSATPQTLVVLTLDPPIRKGNTLYAHLMCQFPTDDEVSVDLALSGEALAAKNEKNGGRLEPQMSGAAYDVFARVLRGLSGARITRPGAFKNASGDGPAIRCSYKADDGYLYPLDRAFFYVHKPPMLVPHDEIESVEFQRQASGVLSSSVRTFDLVVRTKSEQEYLFRSIQRTEWQNLFEFISAKGIRIENMASARQGPGGGGAAAAIKGLAADDDDLGPGLRAGGGEDDDSEDDEDFDAGGSGSSSDDDDEDEGDEDGSGSGSESAEMVSEDGIDVADLKKAKDKKKKKKREREEEESDEESDEEEEEEEERPAKKKKAAAEPSPAKKGKKGEAGGKGKKERKKKDPNAPKGALSAFMYFSNANRERIKAENPGVSFGEVGKLMGEAWKALSAEDKAPYEAKAAADKERYAAAMKKYKASGAAAAADEGGDDGEEDAGDDDDE